RPHRIFACTHWILLDKLCGYIEEHKRMMIRAEYGGCGKSYTCKSMETKGHKVLFVCPTNKLANNYKEHGCTINKFFGHTKRTLWPLVSMDLQV
ncbi:MAG: hypothetical protein ACKPKO_21475, partial [Candidatus Fonsibacter sp.]